MRDIKSLKNHENPASLEFHMDVGRDEFRKFAQLIELQRIDVQGRVSDAVLERLYQKAQFLDGATVAVLNGCSKGSTASSANPAPSASSRVRFSGGPQVPTPWPSMASDMVMQ